MLKSLFHPRARKRGWYVLAMVLTVFAGLASRRFSPGLLAGLGKYPGDVLWALMVFCGLGAIFRTACSLRLALGALGFCLGIELLKLCQAPWLASVRHTTLGHLVFGHVFSWQNLVAYTLGVIVGLVGELLVEKSVGAASAHGR